LLKHDIHLETLQWGKSESSKPIFCHTKPADQSPRDFARGYRSATLPAFDREERFTLCSNIIHVFGFCNKPPGIPIKGQKQFFISTTSIFPEMGLYPGMIVFACR
jgi:hypothetical protein